MTYKIEFEKLIQYDAGQPGITYKRIEIFWLLI